VPSSYRKLFDFLFLRECDERGRWGEGGEGAEGEKYHYLLPITFYNS
jgi:hypothetical protein